MSSFDLDPEFRDLKTSGEIYKQIFNCSVLPIIIHDMYFNIIDVNDKAISEFGYSREEFLELQVFDLHEASELENSLNVLEEMKGKDTLEVKTKFRRKDGSLISSQATPCKINFKNTAFIHVHLRKIESLD